MRYVVVSTNNNPDYYFYAKFLEKAWNSYGWNLCIMVTHDVDVNDLELSNKDTIVVRLPHIPELRIETVAQASRLYAANYLPLDSLIMTSDMDLLPLSNYWDPNPEEITVYGHDLTDYSYYPMGYVAMTGEKWKEYLKCSYNTSADMLRDASEVKVNGVQIAYSDQWEQWWNFDWQLLTNRLKPVKIKFIERGRRLTGTYAYGRIDRGDGMKIPPGETLIDGHCENHNSMHPDKFNKFISLFESVHGKL
jgi:hypothetical protein